MLESLVALLGAYRLSAVFAGAFFFGDSVILTAAYLAGQNDWSLTPLFVSAFLGTAAADTMWFGIGAVLSARFSEWNFMRKERGKAAALLQKLTGENPVYALIFIKFLYGSRIAMILYVAARGMSFSRFSVYNSIGIFVWLAVFFPLGYFAGAGITAAMPGTKTIETAIAVLILSAIVMRIFTLWLTKKVETR